MSLWNIIRPRRSTQAPDPSSATLTQDDLGLQHLKKIYKDYCSLLDETERETTLKTLCPLFVRVFSLHNLSMVNSIQEKLGDVSGFAKHVAQYLTQQVNGLSEQIVL